MSIESLQGLTREFLRREGFAKCVFRSHHHLVYLPHRVGGEPSLVFLCSSDFYKASQAQEHHDSFVAIEHRIANTTANVRKIIDKSSVGRAGPVL